ncbi:hypothetical protein [Solimonas terrae]|uniref:Uncharacterized protein n=1 Tax=Solimonas terrae TaxID=1396819 RepID=A0A6M2BQS1_9GAMM|nr:hypothetical protein [Solimonas terrae]NGY04650.1 hypothetical protein [Solimonas terrae]
MHQFAISASSSEAARFHRPDSLDGYRATQADNALSISLGGSDGTMAGPPPLPQVSLLPLLILILLSVCVLGFLGLDASFRTLRQHRVL